ALDQDRGAVRDGRQPRHGAGLLGIAGLRDRDPQAGLEVLVGVRVGVGDLLQVVQAGQADVGLQQATVGDALQGRAEVELLAGHVELQEAVLPGRLERVRPPYDVEARPGPVPGEPGERAQRIGYRCGDRGCRFPGRGRRRRFFDWRQWPKYKLL